jgi:hypothetical protein
MDVVQLVIAVVECHLVTRQNRQHARNERVILLIQEELFLGTNYRRRLSSQTLARQIDDYVGDLEKLVAR